MSLAAFLQNPFAEGAHTLIPFGFAQFGFIGSSAAIVALGAVAFASDASGSIMEAHVPLPYVLGSFAVLVGATWTIAKYPRSFATKSDLREAERRIKDEIRQDIKSALDDLKGEIKGGRK